MESIIDKVMGYLRARSVDKLGILLAQGIIVCPPVTHEEVEAVDAARCHAVELVLDAIEETGMVVSDKEHLRREFAKKEEELNGLRGILRDHEKMVENLKEQVEHWKKKYEKKIFAND